MKKEIVLAKNPGVEGLVAEQLGLVTPRADASVWNEKKRTFVLKPHTKKKVNFKPIYTRFTEPQQVSALLSGDRAAIDQLRTGLKEIMGEQAKPRYIYAITQMPENGHAETSMIPVLATLAHMNIVASESK